MLADTRTTRADYEILTRFEKLTVLLDAERFSFTFVCRLMGVSQPGEKVIILGRHSGDMILLSQARKSAFILETSRKDMAWKHLVPSETNLTLAVTNIVDPP